MRGRGAIIATYRDFLGWFNSEIKSAWYQGGKKTEAFTPISSDTLKQIVVKSQISDGLAYLHQAGVVHGDLKGPNILISDNGFPLLADFGNANLQEYTLKFSKTSTKTLVSTRWAAPELLTGMTTYSVKADVYALGMTMLEALTGDVPYAGKNEHAVMFAVVMNKEHPERPQEYIPNSSKHGNTFWSLLKRCWSFEPEGRPSAAEVREIMEGITQEGLLSAESQAVAEDDASGSPMS